MYMRISEIEDGIDRQISQLDKQKDALTLRKKQKRVRTAQDAVKDQRRKISSSPIKKIEPIKPKKI